MIGRCFPGGRRKGGKGALGRLKGISFVHTEGCELYQYSFPGDTGVHGQWTCQRVLLDDE